MTLARNSDGRNGSELGTRHPASTPRGRQPRRDLGKRFWSGVQCGGGCWPWQGARDQDGYGVSHILDRSHRAHRVAWVLTYGPIPDGLQVLHECDNPACCRPDHLFLGTQQDNCRDMAEKGRSPRGEQHHKAKLTEAAVRAIRAEWVPYKVTRQELATKYGVSLGAVSGVLDGTSWRHVA